MKAKAIFWVNSDEVEEAERLSLQKIPEPQYEADDFYFDIECVSCFHKNSEGNIVVYIPGNNWTIEYNDELWNKLVKRFSEK